MGTGDGAVLGKTKILDNGSPSARWNLLIMGDGYKTSQMAQYATDAQDVLTALLAEPPFNDTYIFGTHLYDAINVYRVDVTSTDSGADDPTACGGSGATPATYFDSSFCNSGVRRLLLANATTAINVANAQLPQWHMILVMVNSPVYGGGGGAVATFSLAPGAPEIALHEMGHTGFGLADEYEYWAGCGESGHDHHPSSEPGEPNVTMNTSRLTIKWADLIAATTPLPTTANPNCAYCDSQASPVPAGTVGAFEGAHYYHCGCYRPEFQCKMRSLGQPFCAVCQRRIRQTLSPFLPEPPWYHWLEHLLKLRFIREIDLIADPIPFDLYRVIRVLRDVGPQVEFPADDLSVLLDRVEHLSQSELRALQVRVGMGVARLQAAEKMIERQLGKRA